MKFFEEIVVCESDDKSTLDVREIPGIPVFI